MKRAVNYIKEFWHRIGLPSPSFFQFIQVVSAISVFLTGFPSLLIRYQEQLNIVVPPWLMDFAIKNVATGSIIALIISSLPVKNPDATKTKDGITTKMLPFTQKTNTDEKK